MSRWDDIKIDTPPKPFERCPACQLLAFDGERGYCITVGCAESNVGCVEAPEPVIMISISCEANGCARTFFRPFFRYPEAMCPEVGKNWADAPPGWLVKRPAAESRVVVLCVSHAAGVPGVRY